MALGVDDDAEVRGVLALVADMPELCDLRADGGSGVVRDDDDGVSNLRGIMDGERESSRVLWLGSGDGINGGR